MFCRVLNTLIGLLPLVVMKEKLLINSSKTDFFSYRNQFIDLLCKSIDSFLSDRDLPHENVKTNNAM